MTLEVAVLAKGVGAGLAIAAPVGPIGLLCIRRAMSGGQRSGLAAGLGAASADLCYALLAALGLTGVSALLTGAGPWLHRAGCAFLLWLGVRLLFEKAAGHAAGVQAKGLLPVFGSTFLLTLANPMTIASFAGMIAGLDLSSQRSLAARLLLAWGIFLGSALWWLALTAVAARFRGILRGAGLTWINRAAGSALIVFALASAA